MERHAGAGSVEVTLRGLATGEGLSLSVADDGNGFDPAAVGAGHYGLVGLREQAEVIGASVSIGAGPQGGTTVRVVLAVAETA